MDDIGFWSLIDKIDRPALRSGDEDGAIEPLIEALAEHTEEALRGFEDILARTLYDLDGRQYADAAGEAGESGDQFLYLRCYVVARGRKFYEAVKANPSKIPNSLDDSCEALLSANRNAWAASTGNDADSWVHSTPVSYETGSNLAGWE